MSHSTRAERLASPFFVSPKLKTKAPSEGFHLRHRDHLFIGSTLHDNVGVVDHAGSANPLQILEGVGEKQLRIEAIKGGIELEEQHARVAQHQGCGLNQDVFYSDKSPMG
jgi:hypothetical protein